MKKAVVGFTNLADNEKLKLLNLLPLLQQKPGQLELLSCLYMYKFVYIFYIYNSFISTSKIDVFFQNWLSIKQKWQIISDKEETKKSGITVLRKG